MNRFFIILFHGTCSLLGMPSIYYSGWPENVTTTFANFISPQRASSISSSSSASSKWHGVQCFVHIIIIWLCVFSLSISFTRMCFAGRRLLWLASFVRVWYHRHHHHTSHINAAIPFRFENCLYPTQTLAASSAPPIDHQSTIPCVQSHPNARVHALRVRCPVQYVFIYNTYVQCV